MAHLELDKTVEFSVAQEFRSILKETCNYILQMGSFTSYFFYYTVLYLTSKILI